MITQVLFITITIASIAGNGVLTLVQGVWRIAGWLVDNEES